MPSVESQTEELPATIKDLLAWGEKNGAKLNPNVEVYVSPTFGVSLRVKESDATQNEIGRASCRERVF